MPIPRVYPRTCGGTDQWLEDVRSAEGLSPHVRGNPHMVKLFHRLLGSIPARAGEPCARSPSRIWPTVYPRTCGGTSRAVPRPWKSKGLSPHVRGNRGGPGCARRSRGSIPARAGEPLTATQRATLDTGLSPHVRGNPPGQCSRCCDVGSIPARAGEPDGASAVSRTARVYPRTCGGTTDGAWRRSPRVGLSPHVRGNPQAAACRRARGRSIPARAGEPAPLAPCVPPARVYPRTCGGTVSASFSIHV